MPAHSTGRTGSSLPLCLFIILLQVSSFLSAHGDAPPAGTCKPIFDTPLTLLDGATLTYPATPAAKQPSSPDVCPHIAVGSPTCCSADTDAQLNNITRRLLTFRNTLSTVAPAALLQSLFYHQSWLDLTSEHVQWYNLTIEQQQIVNQYLNTITPILSSATPCIDAALTHIQGLLCMSCEPRATDYLTEDGVLRHQWRTCGYEREACVPVLTSVIRALPTLLDLYIGFLLTIPAPLPPLAQSSLSQSYVLRAVMGGGLSSTGMCRSAWMAMLVDRYHTITSCEDVVCAMLDRGLDWDVRRWLNLTAASGEAMIVLPPQGGEGVMMPPSGGGMGGDGGHSAHRRLLSVAVDETSNSNQRLAALSSLDTLSSIVSNPSSRFHVMHGGLHGNDDSMKDAPTTAGPSTLRTFPPTPPLTHSNGRLSSAYGDDDNPTFYPVWSVGCASLDGYGVQCPMSEERTKGSDKAVFLSVVGVVALLLSVGICCFYRAWIGSAEEGGKGSGGDEGLLGVGQKIRKMRAGIGRRLAQRSRGSAGAEEAEGILDD